MLITLYEDNNSAKFSSKFITPILIPKNAEIKLLKAYIPRNHQVEIVTGQNDEFAILLHTEDTSVIEHFTLPAGRIGLEALASGMKSLVRAKITTDEFNNRGQFRGVEFYVDVSEDNNSFGKGCFTINVSVQRLNMDFYYRMNFLDTGNLISKIGGTTNFSESMDSAGTFTLVFSNGSVRPSHKRTAGGVAINKWDNHAVIERSLQRGAFNAVSKSIFNNSTNTDVIKTNQSGTFITWKTDDIVASGNTFWIGIRETGVAIDTSAVTDGLDKVSLINGLVSCVVFYGQTADGKVAGTVDIFEDIAGTFTKQATFASANTVPIVENDKFIIYIPENEDGKGDPIGYQLMKTATNKRYSPTIANAHRATVAEGSNYEICMGWYNQSTTGGFEELRAGMNAGYVGTTEGAGIYDEYGKFAKLILGGAGATANNGKTTGTTLGFSDNDYQEKSATDIVPDLEQSNEVNMVTNDDTDPYINLNITNLPIVSVSCTDPSSDSNFPLQNHDISKTVASIPRFNANGSFNNGALIFDDNTQAIQLKNNQPIHLNSLDIRLQNSDGTYPNDLRTPSSFVFKISGDNLN